jgi:hypothetical protein
MGGGAEQDENNASRRAYLHKRNALLNPWISGPRAIMNANNVIGQLGEAEG